MKEYMVLESKRRDAEKLMNEMAQKGWDVVSVTDCSAWRLRLLITFSRET